MGFSITSFKITSLTPLWTGDVNKHSAEILSSGLMGSLRYWYRILNNELSKRDDVDYGDINSKLNDPSVPKYIKLFGCNGWQKLFKLRIDNYKSIEDRSTFRFQKGIADRFSLDISFYKTRETGLDMNLKNEIEKLFRFIEEKGFLGIGAQNGLGIIKVEHPLELPEINNQDIRNYFVEDITLKEEQINRIRETITEYYENKKSSTNDNRKIERYEKSLSNLRKTNKNYIPIGYEIRRYLKFRLNEDNKRYSIFGSEGKEGVGSSVLVSHPFKENSEEQDYRIRFALIKNNRVEFNEIVSTFRGI